MAELITPDLCIIGAGPAGIAAAREARAQGADVVLVEMHHMGGARTLNGAIAARALAEAAARRHAALAGGYGLDPVAPGFDYAKWAARARAVTEAAARDISAEGLAARGVRILGGEARFADRYRIRVADVTVRARRFILATGSRPFIPPIAGLNAVAHHTTETVFELPALPARLLVVGAGGIAVALAQAYCRLGAGVTLTAAGPLLPAADPELAELVLRRLAADGVVLKPDRPAIAVARRPDGAVALTVSGPKGEEVLAGSHLLLAEGRAPLVDGLDLERAGVKLRRSGHPGVAVGPTLKTANARIYAVGDVTGAEPSDALAGEQARRAVRHALYGDRIRSPLATVPRAVFTTPPLAEIGIAEAAARKRLAGRYRLVRVGYGQNDRAQIAGADAGLVKLVIAPDGHILGAGIVGAEAPELVAILAFAIDNRIAAARLGDFVPPYPAYADLVRRLGEAARGETAPSRPRRLLMEVLRRLP